MCDKVLYIHGLIWYDTILPTLLIRLSLKIPEIILIQFNKDLETKKADLLQMSIVWLTSALRAPYGPK